MQGVEPRNRRGQLSHAWPGVLCPLLLWLCHHLGVCQTLGATHHPTSHRFTAYKDPHSVPDAVGLQRLKFRPGSQMRKHISGPEASSRHRGLESGSPALEPGSVPRAPQMMCSVEVVSSPSLWAFKFGREVVEGTWASCGVSSSWPLSALSFSGPGGEGHPARTFFPGITSLTVSY